MKLILTYKETESTREMIDSIISNIESGINPQIGVHSIIKAEVKEDNHKISRLNFGFKIRIRKVQE